MRSKVEAGYPHQPLPILAAGADRRPTFVLLGQSTGDALWRQRREVGVGTRAVKMGETNRAAPPKEISRSRSPLRLARRALFEPARGLGICAGDLSLARKPPVSTWVFKRGSPILLLQRDQCSEDAPTHRTGLVDGRGACGRLRRGFTLAGSSGRNEHAGRQSGGRSRYRRCDMFKVRRSDHRCCSRSTGRGVRQRP